MILRAGKGMILRELLNVQVYTCIGDESSQFWMSRWVHVFDGSSLQPVQLHLFSTSQVVWSVLTQVNQFCFCLVPHRYSSFANKSYTLQKESFVL